MILHLTERLIHNIIDEDDRDVTQKHHPPTVIDGIIGLRVSNNVSGHSSPSQPFWKCFALSGLPFVHMNNKFKSRVTVSQNLPTWVRTDTQKPIIFHSYMCCCGQIFHPLNPLLTHTDGLDELGPIGLFAGPMGMVTSRRHRCPARVGISLFSW